MAKLTIGQKRQILAVNVALLILYARSIGYGLSMGAGFRDQALVDYYAKKGIGSKKSLHALGLAQDLNLFEIRTYAKNGKVYTRNIYLQKTSDHEALGAYWKSLHPLNRWGGDFKYNPKRKGGGKDGNHYSMAHGTWA